jgi:CxxC motif-containing protein
MIEKLICIACPMGCHLEVDVEDDYRVEGNQCNRGVLYAKKELTNPTRIVTSTVVIKGGIYRRLPVKTNGEVSKNLIFKVMEEINKVEVTSPIKCGDVIIKNVLDTNIDVVASRSM